jgi:hydroxyacylglutathione hydrolase
VVIAEDAAAADGFIRQLVRIGFDRILGFLRTDDLDAAPGELKTTFPTVDFASATLLLTGDAPLFPLDVRKATEFAAGHVSKAQNIAHTRLLPRLAEIPKVPLLVNCQSGQRATGACAFLARKGHTVTCIADKFENAPKGILA